MSKMRASLSVAMTTSKAVSRLFVVTLTLLLASSGALCAAHAIDATQNGNVAMQLAAKIADVDAGHDANKAELTADYEKVYGVITKVPSHWPALVRRVLVCQQINDQTCVRSSLDAIKSLGGANTFALNHLFEVSRFGMSIDKIRSHLHDAETIADKPIKPPVVSAAVASRPSTLAPATSPTPAPAHKTVAALPLAPAEVAAPQPKKAVAPAATRVAAGTANGKIAAPRTLMQKVSSRLGKLSAADTSGFFLDALFVTLVVALLFALFLFSAVRGRKAERIGRLQALQENQHLETQLTEEKLRVEHEIWSEQLKSEVSLEAQKAHADERLRAVQHAAQEAIRKERHRADEEINAVRLDAEQIVQREKNRVGEAIRVEQLKTEEAQKSAKSRSDQAIDAYDQMAARELVFAHQHNDELQDGLKAERERREAQELKTEEVLQALEAMKVREAKLLDIIRGEQRVRASEARQAAEKLKAAQQAAVALQSSLVRARELKADLERRADEAMQAAELRIAAARQSYENQSSQNAQPALGEGLANVTIRAANIDGQGANAEALKGASG